MRAEPGSYLSHLGAPTRAMREAFADFIGREAHPSGGGKAIEHIKAPTFPQFRFEWHPQKRKVYLVRLGRMVDGVLVAHTGPLVGEVVAEHAETHGQAFGCVQTFLRGFREGLTPDLSKPHLEG
jgi:hypothetical protein